MYIYIHIHIYIYNIYIYIYMYIYIYKWLFILLCLFIYILLFFNYFLREDMFEWLGLVCFFYAHIYQQLLSLFNIMFSATQF